MRQKLREMRVGSEERHLAGVDEVAVANRALKSRLGRHLPPHERVDRVDPEMATVLDQMEEGADAGCGVG